MMEEVLTCRCTSQEWTIYANRFQCVKCGHEITLLGMRIIVDILNMAEAVERIAMQEKDGE